MPKKVCSMSKKTGLPHEEMMVGDQTIAEFLAEECLSPAAYKVEVGSMGFRRGAGYACEAHAAPLEKIKGFVVTRLVEIA